MKPTRFIDSANLAVEGILYAVRTQKHMRHHFIAALVVLGVVLFLKVTALEFALLSISICFVLFAELFNTAVETVVDLVSPGFHPLAKIAKDVAAGAVLTAAAGAAVMGCLILSRYILPGYGKGLSMVGKPPEVAIIVSLLAVVIMVVVLKAISGRGRPLEGGLPSGHAAISASIALIVSLETADPVISILVVTLAVMVSHSRLLLRIHTAREVLLGAATGLLLTALIMALFRII